MCSTGVKEAQRFKPAIQIVKPETSYSPYTQTKNQQAYSL